MPRNLKEGEGWRWERLPAVRLGCGHWCIVLPAWIGEDGTIGRILCTVPGCRRELEGVRLEGYAP